MDAALYTYDVAMSFAGAQRPYAHQLAGLLKSRGLRVFLDADEQDSLFGRYLTESLPDVYARESALVVMLVSAQYAAGAWTNLERRAALEAAVHQRREFILPIRFDDVLLPGMLPSLVHLEARRHTVTDVADLLLRKWSALDLSVSPRVRSEPGTDVDLHFAEVDRAWAEWIEQQLVAVAYRVALKSITGDEEPASADGGRPAPVALMVLSTLTPTPTPTGAAGLGLRPLASHVAVARVAPCPVPESWLPATVCDLFGVVAPVATRSLLDSVNAARFGLVPPAATVRFPAAASMQE